MQKAKKESYLEVAVRFSEAKSLTHSSGPRDGVKCLKAERLSGLLQLSNPNAFVFIMHSKKFPRLHRSSQMILGFGKNQHVSQHLGQAVLRMPRENMSVSSLLPS